MKAIVKHEGDIIAEVQTDHSMSIQDVMELSGIDINEMDGGDPKYNLDALTLEMEAE